MGGQKSRIGLSGSGRTGSMAAVNEYAVLKRLPNGSCTVICFEENFSDAQEKMRDLARSLGGEYLVKNSADQAIVALIDVKKNGNRFD
jgi:hypothetical protein